MEIKKNLCLGSVAKGLKFCTLGSTVCQRPSHQKKPKVVVGDLNKGAGRNSAYTNHHIPSRLLSPVPLETILSECHTKESGAVYLLHAWNTKTSEDATYSDSYSTRTSLWVVHCSLTYVFRTLICGYARKQ